MGAFSGLRPEQRVRDVATHLVVIILRVYTHVVGHDWRECVESKLAIQLLGEAQGWALSSLIANELKMDHVRLHLVIIFELHVEPLLSDRRGHQVS